MTIRCSGTDINGEKHLKRLLPILLLSLCLLFLSAVAILGDEAESVADTLVSPQTTDSLLAPPAPATNVKPQDNPNDKGGSIVVNWKISPDDKKIKTGENRRVIFTFEQELK